MNPPADRPDAIDAGRIRTLSEPARAALNADPLSGEPGAHPVGTGLGAAVGGLAGAAIGSIIPGPGTTIGSAVGAAAVPVLASAVGAVIGGLAGKLGGEAANPTDETAYWRETYAARPYYRAECDYDTDVAPAYALGTRYRGEPASDGRTFEDVEPAMRADWATARGASRLAWDDARAAARDAWNRLPR